MPWNAFESLLLDDQNNFKRRKQTFSEEFENDFDPKAQEPPSDGDKTCTKRKRN